jgi:hypothetical protein
VDRDAGPPADHLRDVVLGDLLGQHGAVGLDLLELRLPGLELAARGRELAVDDPRRLLEVPAALGLLALELQLLDPLA